MSNNGAGYRPGASDNDELRKVDDTCADPALDIWLARPSPTRYFSTVTCHDYHEPLAQRHLGKNGERVHERDNVEQHHGTK